MYFLPCPALLKSRFAELCGSYVTQVSRRWPYVVLNELNWAGTVRKGRLRGSYGST